LVSSATFIQKIEALNIPTRGEMSFTNLPLDIQREVLHYLPYWMILKVSSHVVSNANDIFWKMRVSSLNIPQPLVYHADYWSREFPVKIQKEFYNYDDICWKERVFSTTKISPKDNYKDFYEYLYYVKYIVERKWDESLFEKFINDEVYLVKYINAIDRHGSTLLRRLCHYIIGDPEIYIQKLIKYGADINKTPKYEQSPLLLLTSGKNIKIIKMLINAGADVNYTDGFGFMPLADACNSPELTRIFLDAGADVNQQGYDQETALMWAAQHNEEVVKILLEAGADVNIKSINKETALHRAVVHNQENIVKLLLEAGANVFIKNWAKKTPLTIAIENGYHNIVKILEAHISQL
jgi:hypothetical protein